MEEVYVYTVALPGFCREMVGKADGTITVLINSALSDEQKIDALNHALGHIELGHMDGVAESADEAESDARRSPDFAPISRFKPTDEEIPVLHQKSAK